MALLVLLVIPALKVQPDPSVHKVLRARQDLQDRRVYRVRLGHKELLVHKVPRELPAQPDHKDLKERKDLQAL